MARLLARQTIAQSFKQFYGSLSVNIWSLALQCRPYHALGPHCSKLRNGFRSQNQLQLILYCRPKQQSLPARDASFANPQLASFFSTTTHCASSSTKSSGPVSASGYGKLSDTPPTDFAALDVLGDIQGPSAGVEVITSDGFKLSNGIRVLDAGVLLVGGEAFKWRPWLASGGGNRKEDTRSKSKTDLLKNSRGQWEIHESCWGLLDLVWPKPDLLILGTGREIMPLAPQTRLHINRLGVRVEILDSRNAAAQYMLLATERGTEQVAAALVPLS